MDLFITGNMMMIWMGGCVERIWSDLIFAS